MTRAEALVTIRATLEQAKYLSPQAKQGTQATLTLAQFITRPAKYTVFYGGNCPSYLKIVAQWAVR